jgi:activator of HSP90 ATPase
VVISVTGHVKATSTIHLEAKFPVAPERVYELLTNGAKFGEVTGQPGKGGGSTGAYFSLFDGWLLGRQVELVPNELIAQAWRFKDWEPGIYSMVRFQLTPEGKGTRLVLDQNGVPAEFQEHVRTNWDGFYFAPFRKHFQEELGASFSK